MVWLLKQMKCVYTFHREMESKKLTQQINKEFVNSQHNQILNPSFRLSSIDSHNLRINEHFPRLHGSERIESAECKSILISITIVFSWNFRERFVLKSIICEWAEKVDFTSRIKSGNDSSTSPHFRNKKT
jgi:hypothetical protein